MQPTAKETHSPRVPEVASPAKIGGFRAVLLKLSCVHPITPTRIHETRALLKTGQAMAPGYKYVGLVPVKAAAMKADFDFCSGLQ